MCDEVTEEMSECPLLDWGPWRELGIRGKSRVLPSMASSVRSGKVEASASADIREEPSKKSF